MNPETIVFFENRLTALSEARVGILTHALNFGTGVFEGIRGYWNEQENQVFLMRPREHFARWKQNCGILRIEVPPSVAELGELTADLVRRNGFRGDIYIKPLAYKSSQRIGIHMDDQSAFAIVPMPAPAYLDSSKGLHAGVTSWRRIEDNAIPGRAKICGSYVNGALASDEARRNGFDEAILLTEAGHVAEAATSNIFLVRHGNLITPPASENILEGITRASVMELARQELRLEVIERPGPQRALRLRRNVLHRNHGGGGAGDSRGPPPGGCGRDWAGDCQVAPSIRPGCARAAESLAAVADAGVRAGRSAGGRLSQYRQLVRSAPAGAVF